MKILNSENFVICGTSQCGKCMLLASFVEDLPLTFVEHVVDLNGFVIEALSVVDSADIQRHSA